MESVKKFSVDEEMFASNSQRFANYIIDLIIQYALIFILMLIAIIISTFLDSNSIFLWTQNISTFESYLLFFSVMIPYYVLLETYTARTLAKYITKTMVVMEDGSKPDIKTSFSRTFSRIIPFEAFSFFGSNGRGWHDTISKTYVVKRDVFEKQKELFYSFEEIGKKID